MLASRPGNKGRRYPADPPRVEEIVDLKAPFLVQSGYS